MREGNFRFCTQRLPLPYQMPTFAETLAAVNVDVKMFGPADGKYVASVLQNFWLTSVPKVAVATKGDR